MSSNRTEHQTPDEIFEARNLSVEPSRPPAEPPGYKIIKHLGRGAFGEVWLADDLKTGRQVAIKFYTKKSSADISLLASEVEKLALLGADRYVVQLLNVGWDAEPPFYVMDYIANGSLEERLIQNQGIPVAEAMMLFQELATGMLHLHNKGILHCDLKPGNVMLDQEGKPRITDFGQSRLSTSEVPSLGTLFFMAPEQADLNSIPDARWDIYSLGALFFCMLTGKPPYYDPQLVRDIDQAGSIEGRLNQYRVTLMRANTPTEHRRIRGVDRSLADIIDRCIAAKPQKRFESMANLMVGLRQREIARARRPLMVLGLVAPLLLIVMMSLFGWEAFRRSVNQTQAEITRKAIESNQFAAQLAARSASEQINEYFRAVRQLVNDPQFLALVSDVVSDPEIQRLSMQLSNPVDNGWGESDLDQQARLINNARQQLRDNQLRKKLQPFLEERLWNTNGNHPASASWFVCDRLGNQIASAFREPNQTLGKNYAYRSYFTGIEDDLELTEISPVNTPVEIADKARSDSDTQKNFQSAAEQILKRQIIDKPHLSAAFRSDQSNSWKLAFSIPLFVQDQVIGIAAVTVDLGNFIEFANQESHYAILIDDRPGTNRGVILEHPLFQKLLTSDGKLPDEFLDLRVDNNQLQQEDRFLDPVGGTAAGLSYNRPGIFGSADVLIKNIGSLNQMPQMPQMPVRQSGLIVLAIEDYWQVVAPANELVNQWRWLAGFASLALLTISVCMWLLVRQMMAESRQRLERTFAPAFTEAASFQLQDTVAAIDRQKSTEARK